MQMGIFTMGIGLKIKLMDLEHMFTQMVPNMWDIGRMIDRKVTEWKSGLMARDIKEIT